MTEVLHAQSNAEVASSIDAVLEQLRSVVVGQDEVLQMLIVGLLADGHVLLEGVPGVGKTLLARALAQTLGLTFKRVQFTPDLMPTDLLGTRIFNDQSREWETLQGPVFTDVLLADEINRTPPKTQSALLEAMEERQVTLDGERTHLGDAFFVIATENPLEFEGTYPLPEAQTDRFLLKLRMGYPKADAEKALLMGGHQQSSDRLAGLQAKMNRADLLKCRAAVENVKVSEEIVNYVFALIQHTRESKSFTLGASPRAGLMWLAAAKAHALLQRRDFVIPEDIKAITPAILGHRLALSTEAELDGIQIEDALLEMLNSVALRG